MHHILLICSGERESYVRKCFALGGRYTLTVTTLAAIEQQGIESYLAQQGKAGLSADGIIGPNAVANTIATALAQQTGNIGPSFESVLLCQNKYLSRTLQKKVAPEHTPSFCLMKLSDDLPPPLSYPFFVKPVRSSLSYGSFIVTNDQELHKVRVFARKRLAQSNA